MAKIHIRPAVATDLPSLIKMDHSCSSDYVWQMDLLQDDDQSGAKFREIRLPRTITISYPRSPSRLADEWSRHAGMLVAVTEKGLAGYLRLTDKMIQNTAWITDVVVAPAMRRNGVGSALVIAAQDWSKDRGNRLIIIEITTKNAAGIHLARKLGFEFCGYNDHYYQSQEIALFFGRAL
jgi:ribosomal protein S18 acetylase RimI-like enzyme